VRVLVGKVFGIGNAVLGVPLVKALALAGHEVDVLVGGGPDDFGAREVFTRLRDYESAPDIGDVWTDAVPRGVRHDVAVMAIPYDGRWRNGVHFHANVVMDCRPRPGDPTKLGFDSWERHEVEYQMESARSLGYAGETPDCSFMPPGMADPDLVYLGIGYKRDPGGFGLSKHFGNSRFSALIGEVARIRPGTRFMSSGPIVDMAENGVRIGQGAPRGLYGFSLTSPSPHGLLESFSLIKGCAAYLGNDTGMMHVAASLGMPTMGLMAYPGLLLKNPPFCKRSGSIFFTADSPSIESIAELFVGLMRGG
jgi:hypothetical protein